MAFENFAISEEEGPRKLFAVKEESVKYPWQRGLGSFCPSKTTLRTLESDDFSVEEVNCITMMGLFEKHDIAKMDLLQIDVEGYDYEVIELIDFDAIKPVIIRYEHCNLGFIEKKRAMRKLRKLGYKLIVEEHDTAAILRDRFPQL